MFNFCKKKISAFFYHISGGLAALWSSTRRPREGGSAATARPSGPSDTLRSANLSVRLGV